MADSEDLSAPKDNRNGPWLLIGLVALVTLVAVLMVPGGDDTEESAVPTGPAPSLIGAEQAAEQASAPVADSAPLVVPETIEYGPGEAARALIDELRRQTPPDVERAYTAAQRHLQSGEIDDAYLLYFYAAREGHGEAAMVLARQADPAVEGNGRIGEVDELQAHKWYLKARAAGIEEADGALLALRQRVETAAAQGDDRARRIMLQWK